MWGIWRADLSGGASSYFANSELWSNDLMVNLAWSPLYTALLGTIDWLAGTPVAAMLARRYGGSRWLAAGSALLPAALLIVLAVISGDRPTPLTGAYEWPSGATGEGPN